MLPKWPNDVQVTTFFVPLRKSVASLWEQRPLAFGVPRVTGAEKEIFEMYLYVEWNSAMRSSLADVSVIGTYLCFSSSGRSRNEGLRRRRRSA
ncbi:MAG: hypothetical protein AUG89_09040 [Acidobacteria bacterium 13_1_20CM_4_56_7]|nr:MAG: hypothetical protein AUG89_09040 [Acidobacteria bacterium 13_1_20CM_4_56_7]